MLLNISRLIKRSTRYSSINILNNSYNILNNYSTNSNIKLSPAASHHIKSGSWDINGLIGTGKGGKIITKGDVLKAIKAGELKQIISDNNMNDINNNSNFINLNNSPFLNITNISTNDFNDSEASMMRTVISNRLTESKAMIPHYYTSIDCSIDDVLNLRKDLQKNYNIKISVNDFVIRSSSLALRDVPEANGFWNDKLNQKELIDHVDISVAVATPNGLMTPIVKNVDQIGLSKISNNVKDLALRARDGKLMPDEYQGGTFTISNLGMFGIDYFTAVINPPQACILAVSGGKKLPIVNKNKEVETKTMMNVQLSSDRRVIDESISSQFLQAFQYYMSNPKLLIL